MFSDTPITERMFFLPNGNKRAKYGEKTQERETETGDLKQQKKWSLTDLSVLVKGSKTKNFAWKEKSKGSSSWSRWHSGCKRGKVHPNRRLHTCFKQTKAASYPLSLIAAGQSQVCRLRHQSDTWLRVQGGVGGGLESSCKAANHRAGAQRGGRELETRTPAAAWWYEQIFLHTGITQKLFFCAAEWN